tara:strand:- start:369 stop:884 length:516 start_codon:yes stop_codon:yes gene_type:complete
LALALRRIAIKTALRAEAGSKMNATQRLRVRSGRLRNSIAGKVEPRPGGLAVVLSAGGRTGGADVAYAGIQERGGTIRPKRGRYLAIPVHDALFTAAGVQRYPSARHVPGLQFIPRGKPRLIHKETGELYYILKASVTIRPKHYLRDGLRSASARLPEELRALVQTEVAGG